MKGTVLFAAVALAIGGPAVAAQHEGMQQQSGQAAGQQQAQQQQTVQGRILATKDVKAKDKTHQVVLLQTEAGRVIADLGPKEDIDDVKLQEGDQIQVKGHPGRVSDRMVLFASELQAGDQAMALSRPQEEQQRVAQKQQRTPEEQAEIAAFSERPINRELSGKIQKQKEVKLRGSDKTNTVVLLTTEEGAGYLVDLGPTQDLQGVKVASGEQVQVEGRIVPVGDRLVMMATDIDIGGKQMKVKRGTGQSQKQQEKQ